MLFRSFSPFVLVPAGVYAATLALSLTPHRGRRMAFLIIGCAGLVLPALLDASGLVAPSFALRDNTLVILPTMTDLPPALTFLALLGVHVVVLVVAARLIWRVRASFDDTARQLRLLAWQLEHLVPEHEGAAPGGEARPADRRTLLEAILAPR